MGINVAGPEGTRYLVRQLNDFLASKQPNTTDAISALLSLAFAIVHQHCHDRQLAVNFLIDLLQKTKDA
jgi:hypothetical protein